MARHKPAAIVCRLPIGSRATVAGRVVNIDGGRVRLVDGSGALTLSLGHASPGAPALGQLVQATGVWDGTALVVETRRDGVAPLDSFPKAEGDYAHFTADGGRRVANLHRRAAVLGAIRAYFDQRGFLEVETPLMVRSPGTEVHLEAFSVDGGRDRGFLITSPEMHMKRLLGAGLSKIYQISRAFRRDEAGGHHQPEFTMLEWYRGFADASAVMEDTENLVAAVAEEVRGEAAVQVAGRDVSVAPPWRRLRVDEALLEFAGLTLSEVLPDEERFFRAWVEQVEPALGRERATFVTHWPASMASLARLLPEEPASADRFEAYIGGIELCNGFGELVDAREQRRRIVAEVALRAAEGLPAYPVDERFLGALEEGLPDSGGNALGVDRLVMMVCGEDRVSEVMAFPADRV